MHRVIQITDTHFALEGNRSHYGFGYDTDLAWERVHELAFGADCLADAVVVTGDLVDHGLAEEYAHAVSQLSRMTLPTNVVPGNHDFDGPFRSAVEGTPMMLERSKRVGPWEFIFVDSNGEHGDTERRLALSLIHI